MAARSPDETGIGPVEVVGACVHGVFITRDVDVKRVRYVPYTLGAFHAAIRLTLRGGRTKRPFELIFTSSRPTNDPNQPQFN